jgi:hypothetical protein
MLKEGSTKEGAESGAEGGVLMRQKKMSQSVKKVHFVCDITNKSTYYLSVSTQSARRPAGAVPRLTSHENTMTRHIRDYLGAAQAQVIRQNCKGEEGPFFTAKLTELQGILNAMPATYETDGQGMAAVAHLHYFTGSAEWWITELDAGEGAPTQCFGYASLGYEAELGYISIPEILSCGAELDLYWQAKSLAEVGQ